MKLKKKSKKPPLSVIPFKEEEGSYSGSDKHEKRNNAHSSIYCFFPPIHYRLKRKNGKQGRIYI